MLGVGVGGTTGVGAGVGATIGPGIGGLVTGGRTAVGSVGGLFAVLLPEPVFAPSSTVIVGGGVGLFVTMVQAPKEAEATTVTIMGEANVRRGARADMR